MIEKPSEFELDKGLYILDASGTASEGRQMKAQADRVAKRVNDNFDPKKLLSNQKKDTRTKESSVLNES